MSKSVGVITLGCDKNRVDTEHMLYMLRKGGYDITNDYENAQILIVNTCAFIEAARKEAIDVILAAARYKTQSCEKLIVTGCLPQKYASELREGLPEADCFIGISDYDRICEIIATLYEEPVADTAATDTQALQRIVTTPLHYAYLKIADGCDNHCTFCTIPSIRGAYRSRPMQALIDEASALSEQGVKELILVAQDVTRYGCDLYGKPRLIQLLRGITATNIVSVRLLYCYPELVTDELIDEVAGNPKIAKYMDIPIQHADDTVLKRMNRRSTGAELRTLFRKLKAKGIAIRTTVMVGFPQETEENFAVLHDFIAEYAPEHVGVFAYSKEDGTPAARLRGQIPKRLKKQRVDAIGKLHLHNRELHNQAMIGKTLRVLYEDIDYDKNLFVGRSEYDAPDVDTKVYFTADFAEAGEYYDVKITGYEGYDLLGEKAE